MKQSWSMHRWICVGVRFVSVLGGVGLLAAPVAAQGGAEAGRQVTFTKDVAPIVQRSCVTCHRPGQSAPMSLMTYEDARPWGRSMKARAWS